MTTRLRWLKPLSGDAEGAKRALKNPLELISRPIFLASNGKALPGLARWEWPKEKIDGCHPKDFKEFYATQPLFVVGGFRFIVKLGLVPAWYCHKQTRAEAKRLIKSRKWGKLFKSLQGKENSDDDLFGQAAIREFLAFSPPVHRWDEDGDDDDADDADDFSNVVVKTPEEVKTFVQLQIRMRQEHCLRLRKAIEFIVLTEAILRIRLRKGKLLGRFAKATGLPEHRAYPEIVWDYLWIEPAHYCVSVPARAEDIEAIMRRKEWVDQFQEQSGQRLGALYWALKGAPGKFRTISAACEVLNGVYAGLAKAAPRSVLPSEYKHKMKILDEDAKLEYNAENEFIPELGPRPKQSRLFSNRSMTSSHHSPGRSCASRSAGT